jgi:protein-S-isoprenylcysteine O-methyltransferase Ste14
MAVEAHRGLLASALGTIVFVLLVPGTALVLIPYLLTGWRLAQPLLGWNATRWLGVALLVLALPIWVLFNLHFVVEGHGTPAPVAPPERLVVGGPFRWVRNPGYVAGIALLVGQALLFGSLALLVYAAGIFLAFHLFVVFYEEPTLRRQFGAEYEAYCRAVPRWIPRLGQRPPQPGAEP